MELVGYELEESKRDKRKGLIATIVTHALIILLMIFLFKFLPPDPPIEEQGIAINFGTSADGQGMVQPTESPSPTPSPENDQAAAAKPVVAAPAEEVMTSTDPANISIKTNKDPKKPKEKPVKEEVKNPVETKPAEPVINKDALYPGKKSGGSTTSEGETGKPGDQGNPDGDRNATNRKGGPGAGGGGGISYDLAGRSPLSLPKPQYTSEKYGRVVVDVTVDDSGNVIKAKAGARGTTVSDPELFKRAEEAAMKAKFNKGSNDKQVGTITYNFIRN
jgi:outer membrane biosynthesis protein TonB